METEDTLKLYNTIMDVNTQASVRENSTLLLQMKIETFKPSESANLYKLLQHCDLVGVLLALHVLVRCSLMSVIVEHECTIVNSNERFASNNHL